VQVESVWTDRLSIGEIPALAYHAQSASGRRRLAPPAEDPVRTIEFPENDS
jgi:hypothetical protein